MVIKQLIGLIGSILLILGAFSPIVRIPIVGQMNYINSGHGDGILILALGIISIILVLFKKYNPLVSTGITTLGTLGFTYFNIDNLIKKSHAQLTRDLQGNPFKGIAEGIINSVQIEWGFAVIIIGAILLIVTPLLKSNTEEIAPPM